MTWEVMQELEARELLPEDFLIPFSAYCLNTALLKDSEAGMYKDRDRSQEPLGVGGQREGWQ